MGGKRVSANGWISAFEYIVYQENHILKIDFQVGINVSNPLLIDSYSVITDTPVQLRLKTLTKEHLRGKV